MLSSAGESVLDSVSPQMPLNPARWTITRELKALAFAGADLFGCGSPAGWSSSCQPCIRLSMWYPRVEQGSHGWLSIVGL